MGNRLAPHLARSKKEPIALAADRDAHRLPDAVRVDLVILDELGYLPLLISGRTGVARAGKIKFKRRAGTLPTDQQVSGAPKVALGDRRAFPWLFVGNAESRQLTACHATRPTFW